jgi:hypothetical protein
LLASLLVFIFLRHFLMDFLEDYFLLFLVEKKIECESSRLVSSRHVKELDGRWMAGPRFVNHD